MYTEQLKYNYAERFLMMVVELNNSNAYIYLGNLYAKQLRYYQAEQYYLKAIGNKNVMALNNLGVLLFDQKNMIMQNDIIWRQLIWEILSQCLILA